MTSFSRGILMVLVLSVIRMGSSSPEKMDDVVSPVVEIERRVEGENGAARDVCPVERIFLNETISTFSTEVLDIGTGLAAKATMKEFGEKHVALLIYAPWCPFSAKLQPVFKEVAARFPRNKVLFAKVNGVADRRFVSHQLIRGFPAVSIYKNGKPVVFYDGEKSMRKLVKFVKDTTGAIPREVEGKKVFDPVVAPEEKVDLVLIFSIVYITCTACVW
eukprot:CAMPEP_0184488000 /NCGR_PEP_ID=MMETSP0113_2-20130426/10468_1 /TAXON_ID=91329 /ORGANISM="Norrisiella sphaerica, Strain BC52" /LENGTH=217 /DNA_ID=CAMNT_0026870461 /DNA_START=112 /DNA_END=762 /DNA_ORIENTATION=-